MMVIFSRVTCTKKKDVTFFTYIVRIRAKVL